MIVTEPQTWTIIAVMAACFFGIITLVATMFTRVIKAEIGGVRSEIGGVRSEFGAIKSEIGGLHLRFDAVDKRIDNLDRDVQFLMRREIERDN